MTIPPTAYGDLQWNLTLFYIGPTLFLGIIVLVILVGLNPERSGQDLVDQVKGLIRIILNGVGSGVSTKQFILIFKA